MTQGELLEVQGVAAGWQSFHAELKYWHQHSSKEELLFDENEEQRPVLLNHVHGSQLIVARSARQILPGRHHAGVPKKDP